MYENNFKYKTTFSIFYHVERILTNDTRTHSHNVYMCLCYRHEVPVTNDPITIVHMDDDIVVVNKPASIPVT